MFAGIGGFRSGLSKFGDFFVPVGFCEIDPYARRAYEAIYDTKGELFFEDARKIVPESLPDIDLICGVIPEFGMPNSVRAFQSLESEGALKMPEERFSLRSLGLPALKDLTFSSPQNVPGLLSHDGCRTFATILGTLDELGYHVAWQVLNSANFGVHQFRKRVLLVGYLGEESGGEILSFTEANPKTIVKRFGGRQGDRVYAGNGLSCTLTSSAGGFAGNTGLYFMDMNTEPKITELARCITARQDSGIGNRRGEHSGVLELTDGPRAFLTPDREKIRQRGRRMKEPDEPMFTLTAQDRHGIYYHGRIRKLTPLECWRLQGFTDEQFLKAQSAGISDARLYKMAGNAVSVPVITALGAVIKRIHERKATEEENHAEPCNQ